MMLGDGETAAHDGGIVQVDLEAEPVRQIALLAFGEAFGGVHRLSGLVG